MSMTSMTGVILTNPKNGLGHPYFAIRLNNLPLGKFHHMKEINQSRNARGAEYVGGRV